MSKIPVPHRLLISLWAIGAALVPALLQVYTGNSRAQLSTPAAVLLIAATIAHALTRPQPPSPPPPGHGGFSA